MAKMRAQLDLFDETSSDEEDEEDANDQEAQSALKDWSAKSIWEQVRQTPKLS